MTADRQSAWHGTSLMPVKGMSIVAPCPPNLRNLLDIQREGGLPLRNGDRLVPDVVLAGRDAGFFGRILSVKLDFGWWVFDGFYQPSQRSSWTGWSDQGGPCLGYVCAFPVHP